MQFGICCHPLTAPQNGQSPTELLVALRDAGADYIEMSVPAVMSDDAAFDTLQRLFADAPLSVRAFNGFLPATQRITGPGVHLDSVLDYCREAMSRCRALGADVIVLGSAGARRVPEGFDYAQAEAQFVEFGRALGPVAEDVGVDIAIEPLNAAEDNLILSVAHGARLMGAIAHPRIRLLADLYHIELEGEPLSHIADAGSRLRHTHLADLGRVAPGYADGGEADFLGFFRALRRAGYADGPTTRCSFEGRFDDILAQTGPLLRLLRDRWKRSEAAA